MRALLGGLLVVLLAAAAPGPPAPATVRFASADGATALVGYLFLPAPGGPHPALVLLHGRSGLYSAGAGGVYDASTLSRRHLAWARFWAARGYAAPLVDSFGPRGYPGGFPRGSHASRPAAVSEETVRPRDAHGALAYLRTRADVRGDRIGLQGWSNGAMAALVAVSPPEPGPPTASPPPGFRAALALYPGCGMARVQGPWVPQAPVLLLIAGADDEVSPARCQALAARSQAAGGPVEAVVYEGAGHGFDDPGRARQSHAPDRRATEDAHQRAERFFRTHLGH